MDAPRSFPRPLEYSVPIRKGNNTLAVLVKNWGRYRLTTTYNQPLAKATGWGATAPAGWSRQRRTRHLCSCRR